MHVHWGDVGVIGSMRERFRGWLVHPRLPLHLALLAIALCLPALGVGWQLDDNFHRLVLLDRAASDASPLEIFSVLRGRPQLVREFVDAGIMPWWTSESFQIAFLRHLSAATAWLDFTLWPRSAPAQHAHSLLWLGAVVLAAGLLYRRLEGAGATAGLAALLYAIDDAHGTAAGWLANRNALIASFFGILCLLFHHRWRRDGRRAAAFLAPACLALALAGGELALGAAGFLLAYACFLDPAATRGRLASLVPCGLVLLLWAGIYRWAGFGARGSGLYVDPLAEPALFAAALADRLPFFVAGQLTPMAADLGSLAPAAHQRALWWLALALVAGLAAAFWPLVRRDRTARFWALGALLATVPLCATFPTNRVLFFTGLGAMPLVARWLGDGARRRRHRILTVLLIATHVVLAALLLPVTSRMMKAFGAPIERAVLTAPSDPGLWQQDLVVVNAPDYLTYVSQMPALFALAGRPQPLRIRGLAIGPSPVTLRRVDERTLDLEMEAGFLSGPLGDLYRPPGEKLAPGDRLEVSGMRATVLATTGGGRPRTVRFRFQQPLESPRLRWVAFGDGRFSPFAPPGVGDELRIPAAFGPFDALLSGASR